MNASESSTRRAGLSTLDSAQSCGRASAQPESADRESLSTYLDAVGRFVDREVDPRRTDSDGRITEPILRGLADIGAFGVSIPEADGGGGGGLFGACATVERIARRDRSVATTVGMHLGMGTRGLVAFGTEAQRSAWLPSLAAGHALSSFATTEPAAGSDFSGLRTAVSSAGPGRLRLSGQKAYVTNGGFADVFTVTAKIGGAHSESDLGESSHVLVLLDRETPGLEVGNEERTLGLRGSATVSLHLDGVEVGEDRILGAPGEGRQQLDHVLSWGRAIMASGCVGAARRAFELALEHTGRRHQFGGPLSAIPVVRRQLAEMRARHFAMGTLVDEAARVESNVALLEVLSLSAKVFCSEGSWLVCDRALQLHGGAGYLETGEMPLLLRDARISRIFHGANDVLLSRIGAAEYERPRRAGAYEAETEIDGVVWDTRQSLLQRSGRRGLGDSAALHRLGRLVVLRDATRVVWARSQRGSEEEQALAALWVGMALAEARGVVVEETAAFDELVIDVALGERAR